MAELSWLRTGDNAATNPIVLRAVALLRGSAARVFERDVIKAELFGFVSLCATLSTSHDQDYSVSYGTAYSVAGPRTDRLLGLAVEAGYMTKVPTLPDREERWLIDDDPEFLHMRTKAEKLWEAQRKKDNSNPALIVPVRLRDGDACRYCGRVVYWNDRKSDRGGTYDHRQPGQPATVETYVVACVGCNSARGNKLDADLRVPLLQAPARPYYSESTRAYLVKHGQLIATENSDPATGRNSLPATRQPAGTRDSAATAGAPVRDRSADPSDRQGAGSGLVGPGRAGSGRDPSASKGSAGRARRGKRGGRNR